MPRRPDAGRAGVHEKHRVVGRQFAQRRGQKFRTDRLDPRAFLDVMLQKLMERVRSRRRCFSRNRLSVLSLNFGEQRGDGRLDVAHQPQIHRGPPPDVFRVPVDLDFLDAVARQKFRERKVGAEQQHQIRIVNGLDRLRRSQAARSSRRRWDCRAPAIASRERSIRPAPSAWPRVAAPRRAHRGSRRRRKSPPYFAASIISASLSRSASAGRNTGGAGIVTRVRGMVRRVRRCDVARQRDHRRTLFDHGGQNRAS